MQDGNSPELARKNVVSGLEAMDSSYGFGLPQVGLAGCIWFVVPLSPDYFEKEKTKKKSFH